MENVDKHPKTGVYRVRLTYPVHLRKILGRSSVTQSLGTRDAAAARKAAIPVLAELQKRIAEAQAVYDQGSAPPPPKPIPTVHEGLRLIQQWKERYLAKRLHDLNSNIRMPETREYFIAFAPNEEEDEFFQPDNWDAFFKNLFKGDVAENLKNWTLNRILRQSGYELPEKHMVRTALLGPITAMIQELKGITEPWERGQIDVASLPPERKIAPVAPPTPSPEPKAESPGDSAHGKIRLSELMEKHLAWKKPKSENDQRLAVRQLCDFLGQPDPFANDITHAQAEEFYEILKLQPKSRSLKDARLSLREIAKQMQDGSRKQSFVAGGTAAKKIAVLSGIFNRGSERKLISGGNPFARLIGPQDATPNVKRLPFTEQHLELIFSAPLFQGCAAEDNWRKSGKFMLSNHRFWLPLLALTTGCRIEELGQLQVSDIKKQDGILYLNITDDHATKQDAAKGPKSVKTPSSKRKLPLHKIVLDAGFEEYWRARVENNDIQVFLQLPAIKNRTKEMSRWFNRDFLHSIGIDDPSYVFHSFRHGFKDYCRAAGLHPEVHHTLTGHRKSTGDGYGEGLSLAALKKGIDALTFPGLPEIPKRT